MNTVNTARDELVKLVTKLVTEELSKQDIKIPLGVSGRHVHLNRADMDVLFGPGSQLTKIKDLKQPGQYAAKETITIKGSKGAFERVRILGPLREETQVEISVSDGFKLGIKAPLRESGQLAGTPGLELIGPEGTVKKECGTIVALRHIHMTPAAAKQLGLADKQAVKVELGDDEERGAILKNVLLRISDKYAVEMHLDQDEANAVGARNGQYIKIVK